MNKIRVRFAPSPTGHLHIGNARTAIFNWLFAKKMGGVFVLRIENTDVVRDVEGAEEIIYDDMRWLGMDWQEGPDIGGPYGAYRQSERLELYQYYAKRLLATNQAYYCFCSDETLKKVRNALIQKGEVPRYLGTCAHLKREESKKRLERGEPAAIRFRIERLGTIVDLIRGEVDFSSKIVGDPVILRRDGRPTYNYAVVVDDACMRITHVLRGEDHLSNTPVQIRLYDELKKLHSHDPGIDRPFEKLEPDFEKPHFAHFPMIMGPDGSRLSKRHGATSVSFFKEDGYLPEALLNYLALLGWSPPDEKTIISKEEMINDFELKRISKASAIFDLKKLNWMNASYIRMLGPDRILSSVENQLKTAGYLKPPDGDEEVKKWLLDFIELFSSHLEKVSLLPQQSALLFTFRMEDFERSEEAKKVLKEKESLKVLKAIEQELEHREITSQESYIALMTKVKNTTGTKGKSLFHPLRIAATLSMSGPELDKLIPLIERGKNLKPQLEIIGCLERIRQVMRSVESGHQTGRSNP